MYIVCSDLESVFIPEIWVTIAEATGIQKLQLTTRDIPNYEALMKQRLQILLSHRITLNDVQKIIRSIKPFDGALTFLNWLRKYFPTIILTDSFYEFVTPLMRKLAYPTVFSNSLEIDKRRFITNYRLREQNGKVKTLKALKSLKFQTIAIGDSYNDVDMLKEADEGILYKPNQKICKEFPDLQVANSYDELKNQLIQYITLKIKI
jgi:phosphoserine/homoserine phosphotransferase